VTFPVRHGNYDVAVYSTAQKALTPTNKIAVICEQEPLPNGYSIESCVMHIDYPIDSMQAGVI
jgi:hypothetical protein